MKEKRMVAAGVDNTARRTWNKEEYAEKAAQQDRETVYWLHNLTSVCNHQDKKNEESALDAKRRKRLERDPLHQGLIVERANLKQRDFQLDLTSRLGKTQVVTTNTPLSQQAGYYCSVCDCILRDSHSYLDHINGKYHNRALGMSMVVERSTVEDVKGRLEAHKRRKNEPKPVDTVADGFDRAVLERQDQEEREREERRQRKKRREQKRDDDEEEEFDAEEDEASKQLALSMGFAGFGTTKN